MRHFKTDLRAPWDANLTRLYWFLALTNISLWMPIWVVFLHEARGLSLAQIYTIAGAGWFIQALADVPTGALSDSFGRRRTVIAGVSILAVGLGTLGIAHGLTGVASGYLLWAVGMALVSGTDEALLFESARLAGRESDFARISSNSYQITQIAQAGSAIAGGLLATWRLDAPMILTALFTAASIPIIWGIKEPVHETSEERLKYREAFATSAAYLRRDKKVVLLIVYNGLIAATTFFVPFILFQPDMQHFAVPLSWFGTLFTGLRLAAVAGSRYGSRLLSDASLAPWMSVLPLVMALSFVGISVSPHWYWAYLGMVAVSITSSALRPHLQHLLNRMILNRFRATVLSTNSVTMTILIALLHPTVGATTDRWSIDASFLLLGLLTLIALLAYVPLARTIRQMKFVTPGDAPQP